MATKRASLKDTLDREFDSRDLPMRDQVVQAYRRPSVDQMVVFSVRLPSRQKAALMRYFKDEKGLDLSNGIRMVLTGYMREENVTY